MSDGRSSRLALVLLTLAVGAFGIGTGEFVAMGLLPEISRGVDVSVARTGTIISAYAVGVVVGAPLIVTLGARLPRRPFLVGLVALFVLGNLASAMAPGYLPLVAARFTAGLPHGAFYAVAALVAADMAGPGRRAWGVARVLLGLSVANVVGVPAATGLGQALGWRTAFAAVAVVGVVTIVALLRVLPHVPAPASASPRAELGALRRPQVLLTVAVGAIGFGAMFSVYTYISPTLTEHAGLAPHAVPGVLVVWGLGMVVGSLVGGRLVDRSLIPALFGILASTVLFTALFAVGSANPWTATGSAFLVGTSVALVPGLQTRLMDVAGDAQTLAAALNHSALNIANASGAWLGGVAITAGGGWTGPAWVGSGLALAGLVTLAVSVALERRRSRRLASPNGAPGGSAA